MDQKVSPLVQEVLNALLTKEPKFAEALPVDDPLRKHTDTLGALFTEGVAVLRDAIPNPKMNKFGALLWDIIGHSIVSLAIGPNVPTMSFAGYADNMGVYRGIIFVPHFWNRMVQEDSMMQFGAIVFNGSKAIDFYNHRIEPDLLDKRATLWESEFLCTLQRNNPNYEFNDYQKQVIKAFPGGLESPGAEALLYESIPFFVPSA